MDTKEKQGRLQKLYKDALALLHKEDATSEEVQSADTMLAEALDLREQLSKATGREAAVSGLEAFLAQSDGRVTRSEAADGIAALDTKGGFKSFGEYLVAARYGVDPRLQRETKDLAEAGGASGGFLVPSAFDAQLRELLVEASVVRSRATVIPMVVRSIMVPVLDQTAAPAAGAPYSAFLGGVYVEWTEEAAEKPAHDPKFRQIALTVHKMTAYTRSSDELLADSAVSLEALITRLMGSAVAWAEDQAFLRGDGVGKPLGVLNAPALISLTRAAAGNVVDYADVVAMVSRQLVGAAPVFVANPSLLPDIYRLQDAAGHYIWHPNVSAGAPTTILGIPLVLTEKLPVAGQAGDILLADFSYYLIGDRQAMTIAASEHERFRYDQTAWRVVARVDGQPWLSAPVMLNDGVTTVSPFVSLAAA